MLSCVAEIEQRGEDGSEGALEQRLVGRRHIPPCWSARAGFLLPAESFGTAQALLSARAEKTIAYNTKVKDAGVKTQEALSELTNKYKEDVQNKMVRPFPAGPVHCCEGAHGGGVDLT